GSESSPGVDMSAASCLLSEDQFLCSICLDVFMNPVSTPCGHNFCKKCITQHWDTSPLCRCPICKRQYKTRPELHVNTFISEMAQQSAKPGEVPCDVCSATKLKALKSCLVCLASYCATHLEPHQTVSGLKRHQLIDPVMNLERRICLMHNKPLEMFCKTNQSCVCVICSLSNHKTHDVVPLKEEYEVKMAGLVKKEAELQAMIVKRLDKIREIKDAVQLSKDEADRELEGGVQFFADLMESVERGLKEFMEEITEKQRRAEKQAEDLIKELEQEIFELTKRSSEVEELSRSEDHLHVIQNFSSPHIQSLTAPPSSRDWPNVIVTLPTYRGTVFRAVVQLDKNLNKQMSTFFKAQHKKVQRYAVDVTFDPSTAKPGLTLSEDGKQVHGCDQETHDSEDRKDNQISSFVLGAQSFSSGKFYYEVDVKEKIEWDLGVAGESVSGERSVTAIPQNKLWTISLRVDEDYRANNDPSVSLILKWLPDKVGVFVDYEERLISFYEVDESAPIYSFTGCRFTGKLRPFFSPGADLGGKNSTPLTITPVSLTEQDSMAGTI
uniref:Uncharacterized protein n=1 Tax=Amphilophus citrinellus TaxID=61819 RepID=A0A3Q0SGH4_AMPCI